MNKFYKQLLLDLAVCMVGITLMTITIVGVWGLFIALIGGCLVLVPMIDLVLLAKRLDVQGFKKLRELRDNNQGIAWVWASLAGTLVMGAILYFVLGWPLDIMTNYLGYTFTGVMSDSWVLTKLVISYLLALLTFAVVIHTFVNTKADSGGG